MNAVKAVLVDDIDEEVESGRLTPGAYSYYQMYGEPDGSPPAGMMFICVCGCGRLGSLSFRQEESPRWDWNGNVETPTLSPSIHWVRGCPNNWHGYLTNGEFVPC